MRGDLEVVGRRRARVSGYFQDAELFGMHLHFVACGGRRVRRRWEVFIFVFFYSVSVFSLLFITLIDKIMMSEPTYN
jgi:hypothetical protein